MIQMVMSKAIIEAQIEEQKTQMSEKIGMVATNIIAEDGWHTKKGDPNTSAKRIMDTIMEFLDKQKVNVAYSDIKNYLIENIPDDCFEYEDGEMGKTVTWEISTIDIQKFVKELVDQGFAIDQ